MKKLIYILLLLPCLSFGQDKIAGFNDNNIVSYGQDSTNFSGDINASGYILPSKYIHVTCYRSEAEIEFTITEAEVWHHLTNATNDLFNTCELHGFSMTNDTLSIDSLEARYSFNFHLNFLGVASKNYKCRIFNVTQNSCVPIGDAQAGRGADMVSIDPWGYQHAHKGDKYVIQIQNADSTDNLTIKSLQWSVLFLYKE